MKWGLRDRLQNEPHSPVATGTCVAMSSNLSEDKRWMLRALALAEAAAAMDEVPVGAVLVRDAEMLGNSGNRVITDNDPSGHAEVLALRAAARAAGTHRLDGATLYVTLEPCLMCCGALLNARVQRLVFGAREPRTGGVVSAFETLIPAARQQHHVAIDEGVYAERSLLLLKRFFDAKRL